MEERKPLFCPACGTPYGKRERCYTCRPARKRTGAYRPCLFCGTPFYVPKSLLDDTRYGAGRYCTKEHRALARRGQTLVLSPEAIPSGWPKTRPCDYCGEAVTKTKTQAQARKYWTCDASCAARMRRKAHTPTQAIQYRRGQQETRPCAVCGVPVFRTVTPKNREKRWYCTPKHRAEGEIQRQIQEGVWVQPRKPRRGDMVPCAWCGEPWYRQPAHVKQGRRYCKAECWRDAQRAGQTHQTCLYCGETFVLRSSGQSQQYCKKACEANAKIARPLDRMHNGRPVKVNDKGYVLVWEPDHPNANRGWLFEHRLVMEQHLGRYLCSDEQVDHVRASEKGNNDISNLQVLSPSEHARKTQAENLGALPMLRTENVVLRARVEKLEQALARFHTQEERNTQ